MTHMLISKIILVLYVCLEELDIAFMHAKRYQRDLLVYRRLISDKLFFINSLLYLLHMHIFTVIEAHLLYCNN